METFRFLHLPLVALRQILIQMDFIRFATLSRRCQMLVKISLPLKISEVIVTHTSYEHTVSVKFEPCFEYHRHFKTPDDQGEVKPDEYHLTFGKYSPLFMHTYNYENEKDPDIDFVSDMKKFVAILRGIYPIEHTQFNVNADGFPDFRSFFINQIVNRKSICTLFRYGGQNGMMQHLKVKDEDMHFILDNLPMDIGFRFDGELSEEFKYDKNLNFKEIDISAPKWFTSDHLLNSNFEQLTICWESNLKFADINLFMKKWLNHKIYKKFEWIWIDFDIEVFGENWRENETLMKELLEGIETKPFDESRNQKEYLSVPLGVSSCQPVYDVCRKDGSIASIGLDDSRTSPCLAFRGNFNLSIPRADCITPTRPQLNRTTITENIVSHVTNSPTILIPTLVNTSPSGLPNSSSTEPHRHHDDSSKAVQIVALQPPPVSSVNSSPEVVFEKLTNIATMRNLSKPIAKVLTPRSTTRTKKKCDRYIRWVSKNVSNVVREAVPKLSTTHDERERDEAGNDHLEGTSSTFNHLYTNRREEEQTHDQTSGMNDATANKEPNKEYYSPEPRNTKDEIDRNPYRYELPPSDEAVDHKKILADATYYSSLHLPPRRLSPKNVFITILSDPSPSTALDRMAKNCNIKKEDWKLMKTGKNAIKSRHPDSYSVTYCVHVTESALVPVDQRLHPWPSVFSSTGLLARSVTIYHAMTFSEMSRLITLSCFFEENIQHLSDAHPDYRAAVGQVELIKKAFGTPGVINRLRTVLTEDGFASLKNEMKMIGFKNGTEIQDQGSRIIIHSNQHPLVVS